MERKVKVPLLTVRMMQVDWNRLRVLSDYYELSMAATVRQIIKTAYEGLED